MNTSPFKIKMLNPIILYRNDVDWRAEEDCAKKYFNCIGSRTLIPQDSFVIPRFSALPFYKELEDDVLNLNSKLINSYSEHRYIADLGEWYEDLKEFTPQTWRRLEDLPENGPFVLKGETNSKKYLWNKAMFAKDKKEAIEIHSELTNDSLLTYQNIYIRKYIPLKRFLTGLNGLPITNEFRFFVYKDTILSGGYYWSSHVYDLNEIGIYPDIDDVPEQFLKKIIDIVKERTNFYVIDVAKTESGDWILIELNDGSQSGLSENDPEILYQNLKSVLNF